jgi:hypothetical protein
MGNCYVTHGSYLCVGKNDMALLYNLLELFRLSAGAESISGCIEGGNVQIKLF